MKAVFRVDASLQIGSGHVMRCLTLAEALRAQGAQCGFISREHSGHLLELIRERGFAVAALPANPPQLPVTEPNINQLAHAAWLGCEWQIDMQQTRAIAAKQQPDWLVVDHYALDQRWESAVKSQCKRMLVIDDLADRYHNCELLLDQNLGRKPQDYAHLVPAQCKVLTGPQFAPLRPEFAALRDYSLQCRLERTLKKLLITMGGVDQPNATGQVLQTLKACALPQDCRIGVVMGSHAPWLLQVQAQAQDMPWPTEVLVNVSNMAERMADSDLAIGAAGSTSWERCCLGLPALIVVLADNQRLSAQALQEAQAALLLGDVSDIATQLPPAISAVTSNRWLRQMGITAAAITDGQGAGRVLKAMRCQNA